MVVRHTQQQDLTSVIYKLINVNLVPGSLEAVTIRADTVTHVPTQVTIDCDIDGYYLTAPRTLQGIDTSQFYDYTTGDYVSVTTDPKVIALGWLLTVTEHMAISTLEDK